MCQLKQQFPPKKPRCDTQCSVLYSDWSLQMGQVGPKMTLGTLTMSGMTFQRLGGPSGAQIAFTMLLGTSIGDTVTQCTAHDRGVANAVTVGI